MSRARYPDEVLLAIAARDGYCCRLCGHGWLPSDPWEVDHWLSVKKGGRPGGRDLLSNLGLMHRSCNRKKGAA